MKKRKLKKPGNYIKGGVILGKSIIKLLEEYPNIMYQIGECHKTIKEKILDKIDKQDTLKSNVITDMPRGGGEKDQVCVIVQKIIDDLVSEIILINKKLDELNEQRRQIERIIVLFNPTDYKIINLRHFQRKPFWMIGREMHYSKTQIYRMHQDIIDGLEKGTYGTHGTK
jgi:hypothetical protein